MSVLRASLVFQCGGVPVRRRPTASGCAGRGAPPGSPGCGVGFIEFDESVEEVLRREIRKELGVEIQDLRISQFPDDYLYAEIPHKTADLFFVDAVANPE